MTNSESAPYETDSGVEYTPHSMMHKAIVNMEPTKLEMLERFERADAGHKYIPQDSNVRVIITGRDWSEESLLIYGTNSSEEAEQYVDEIISQVNDIGHSARLINGPEIANIAVSGDLGTTLQLEEISVKLYSQEMDVEYEPEQFPGAIVRLNNISATFLLFSTGKFIIQGLSSLGDIEPAIDTVQDLI